MDERLTESLQRAYHFTPEDFQENSSGRLTPRQKKVLKSQRFIYFLSFGVFVFVMLATLGFLAFMSDSGSILDDLGFQITALSILGIIGIYTPFFLYDVSALSAGTVRGTEGAATINAENDYHAKLTIGKVSFFLPGVEPFISAFKQGEHYKVFYLPAKRPQIISGAASNEARARDSFVSSAELGEHPGLAMAKRAPLIFGILLTAMVAGPLFFVVLARLARRMELSGGAWLGVEVAAFTVFAAVYLTVILRVLSRSSSGPTGVKGAGSV